jgi:alpha/beta superfamily hydrolase
VGTGQDCGEALGPLYETLAAQAEARGFAVVRFQWAYCQSFNGQNGPSQGLRNEIEDYETVWDFTRLNPGKFGNRIFVTGKALGGIVANAVLRGHNDLKGALFLAPICSLSADENGNPLPQPLPVAEQNYFGIKQERRLALFLSGKQDPLCNQTILSEFLKTAPRNISKAVVLGDNDLRVLDHTGHEDSVATKGNLSHAVQISLDWLERALGQHLEHFY